MNVSKTLLIFLAAFLSACSLNDTYQGDGALIAQLSGEDSNASQILNDIWALETMAGEALGIRTFAKTAAGNSFT